MHTRDGLPAPDIQLHFLAGSASDDGKALMRGHSFTLGACVLRPQSRGSLRLKGNTFAHHPDIDFAFLSEEEDKVTLLRGARMAYDILNAPAFTPYCRKPRTPVHLMKSDEDFLAHIRASAATAFHPVGTCKMGPDGDPLAVVDAQLRVRGVEGLRVADASIMPTIISGNTNAPCIMIGEKTADMILRAGD